MFVVVVAVGGGGGTFKEGKSTLYFYMFVCLLLLLHYENMSVQYEAISKSGKNDILDVKNVTFFLIFAQNIDCGYTLEPPH